jgi:TonB family protein
VELPLGPDQQQARVIAESLLRELSTAPSQDPAQPQVPPPQLEIEGPVGEERRVLSRPEPPSVTIRHSADVRLKFYVSPRGEVVRAFPIERGDTDLDRVALAYLKQFRFNALPHGDQREQWGTIRVRFRLE